MFTGIVQAVGTIRHRTRRGAGHRLQVAAPFDALQLGESVAVNGACLTVESIAPDGFFADVSAETESKTTLGALGPGSRVNLERALALGDRLGGHLVSGHVDAVAEVVQARRQGADLLVTVRAPRALMHLIAVKGSVALDGASLTVNALRGDGFELTLIPHTLAATTLSDLAPGRRLNLEVDVLARYVERCLKGS